jgi:hypothetical protein
MREARGPRSAGTVGRMGIDDLAMASLSDQVPGLAFIAEAMRTPHRQTHGRGIKRRLCMYLWMHCRSAKPIAFSTSPAWSFPLVSHSFTLGAERNCPSSRLAVVLPKFSASGEWGKLYSDICDRISAPVSIFLLFIFLLRPKSTFPSNSNCSFQFGASWFTFPKC